MKIINVDLDSGKVRVKTMRGERFLTIKNIPEELLNTHKELLKVYNTYMKKSGTGIGPAKRSIQKDRKVVINAPITKKEIDMEELFKPKEIHKTIDEPASTSKVSALLEAFTNSATTAIEEPDMDRVYLDALSVSAGIPIDDAIYLKAANNVLNMDRRGVDIVDEYSKILLQSRGLGKSLTDEDWDKYYITKKKLFLKSGDTMSIDQYIKILKLNTVVEEVNIDDVSPASVFSNTDNKTAKVLISTNVLPKELNRTIRDMVPRLGTLSFNITKDSTKQYIRTGKVYKDSKIFNIILNIINKPKVDVGDILTVELCKEGANVSVVITKAIY